MTRQIVKHTSQAYVLSLNIVTQDNTGYSLQTIPIVRVTSIIFAVIFLLQTISRVWFKIQTIPSAILSGCEWFYLVVEAGKRQAGCCRKLLQKTLVVNYGGAI